MKSRLIYAFFGCIVLSCIIVGLYFIFRHNDTISTNSTNTTEVEQKLKTKAQKHINYSPFSELPSAKHTCLRTSKSLVDYYQNASDSNLNKCCYHVHRTRHECEGIIKLYAPEFKYILKNRPNQMTPNQMCCTKYNMCNDKIDPIDFTIKFDREPLIKEPKEYEFDEKTFNSSSLITILQLSDFHYDPYYEPGSSSKCIESTCCRNSSVPKRNTTQKAGFWGDYHKCDSPGHLVENTCTHISQTHKNIDLIYYTGDFGDHFDWLSTRLSVMRGIEYVTKQMKQKFPNMTVIMTLGNIDIHPANAFSPRTVDASVNSQWLYNFVADAWSDWLPQSALSTLRVGGYYSLKWRPGFRIIVLNNNHCNVLNTWLYYSASEMVVQLEWLRDTLIAAEKHNETVHILGHFPPNSYECIIAWNREYYQLIQKFAHIISGQFNGHTCTDGFTLFYSMFENESIPLNVAWNGGSASTSNQGNPNYRLYTVETNTYEVIDVDTYIFNLTAANLTPNHSPKWFKEYSFREAFDVDDLSPYTLDKLVNVTWRYDRQSLYKMWTFYHKMSDVKLAKGCNEACLDRLQRTINGNPF